MSDSMSYPVSPDAADPAARVSRWFAAMWGAFIGGSLAMPAHWYYHPEWIERDYGTIVDYEYPISPHPESILYRSRYVATGPKDDILHEQARFWGKPGIHYHQFMEAGENTLNVRLMRELMGSLVVHKGYNQADYIARYLEFMLTSGTHNDTYIEESHRHFFQNYGQGRDPLKCGEEDIHIGGLTLVVPLILFYAGNLTEAKKHVRAHLALTHPGETMARAAELITELIVALVHGADLGELLLDHFNRQKHPALGYPFRRWLDKPDNAIVGGQLSSA